MSDADAEFWRTARIGGVRLTAAQAEEAARDASRPSPVTIYLDGNHTWVAYEDNVFQALYGPPNEQKYVDRPTAQLQFDWLQHSLMENPRAIDILFGDRITLEGQVKNPSLPIAIPDDDSEVFGRVSMEKMRPLEAMSAPAERPSVRAPFDTLGLSALFGTLALISTSVFSLRFAVIAFAAVFALVYLALSLLNARREREAPQEYVLEGAAAMRAYEAAGRETLARSVGQPGRQTSGSRP